MCQYNDRCPVIRHRLGTKCPYGNGFRSVLSGVAGLALIAGTVAVVPPLRAMAGETWTTLQDASRQGSKKPKESRESSRSTRRVPKACAVKTVLDGDTLRCADGTRVRLLGVDAPELAHDDHRQQCHAKTSRKGLASMVEGQTVVLAGDPGQAPRDVYGRALAYVKTTKGVDVNVRQVEHGDARARRSTPPLAYASRFAVAERVARATSAGLWAYC